MNNLNMKTQIDSTTPKIMKQAPHCTLCVLVQQTEKEQQTVTRYMLAPKAVTVKSVGYIRNVYRRVTN